MREADVRDLVRLVREGSTEAQEVIMQRFRPLIIHLCSHPRYSDIQDEVTGICHVALWNAVRRYRGSITEKFPGYIKKYLELVLNNAAKKKRRYLYREGNSFEQEHISFLENFDGYAITKEDLLRALRRLNIRERYIIWACFFRHYEIAHLAVLLKTNRYDLHREIYRILKKLRRWCS